MVSSRSPSFSSNYSSGKFVCSVVWKALMQTALPGDLTLRLETEVAIIPQPLVFSRFLQLQTLETKRLCSNSRLRNRSSQAWYSPLPSCSVIKPLGRKTRMTMRAAFRQGLRVYAIRSGYPIVLIPTRKQRRCLPPSDSTVLVPGR